MTTWWCCVHIKLIRPPRVGRYSARLTETDSDLKKSNESKPFDAVHHPDQSEDPQNEYNVQDLTAGVTPRYDRTGKINFIIHSFY